MSREHARIRRAGRTVDRALTAVAAGALTFSTVNVALLAIAHGVPAWVAWLLEPLVGVALWAVLSSDAVLSRYGRTAGPWAWVLRTFAGLATLVLNVWDSVFSTDGALTLAPDPTGIVLHAVAPCLLLLLAEAAPRYRAQFAEILTQLQLEENEPHASMPNDPDRNVRTSSPEARTPHDTTDTPSIASHPKPARAPTSTRPDFHTAWTHPGPDLMTTIPSALRSSGPGPAPHTGPDTTHRSKNPNKRSKRKRRRAHNDARARAILLTEPDISGTELARRLGVETRSGRRILQRVSDSRKDQ